MSERVPVLVVGDAVASTGFARVLHSILERLHTKYEFHHVGLNYYGDPHDFPWKIYPAGAEGDYLGTNRLEGMLRKVKPKLVLLLNDLWVLVNYVNALRDRREGLKLLAYMPVDASPVEPIHLQALSGLDRLYAYTRFGEAAIRASLAELCEAQPGFPFPEIGVIAHGVDTDRFYPLGPEGEEGGPAGEAPSAAGRLFARRQLFPERPDLEHAFIVLNANRNQPRKRIDVTMKGFALFAEGKPENVKLYLHMGVEDLGWNLKALARRYRVEDRLILTAEDNHTPGVGDEVLNRIFNACDVGLNTSTGEGWGLVSCEHAAAGAAQVVPRHSACGEIWEGSALLMEPALSFTMERTLGEFWMVTPEAVAEALERLWADPELLREMSARAYANATRSEYAWNRIAGEWDRIFQEMLEELREG